MMDNPEVHPMRVECEGRFVGLETDKKHVKEFIAEIKNNHLPHIEGQFNTIQSRLNTWFPRSVTVIITFLSSVCAGLIVWMVK